MKKAAQKCAANYIRQYGGAENFNKYSRYPSKKIVLKRSVYLTRAADSEPLEQKTIEP